MGNAITTPTFKELQYVFPPIEQQKDADATVVGDEASVVVSTSRSLGMNHGVPNTTCGPPSILLVNEKYWTWTNDELKLKYSNDASFGQQLQLLSTFVGHPDRTVLYNSTTNEPVAISMRIKNTDNNNDGKKKAFQLFHIYTTHANYLGQQSMSNRKYGKNQLPLYLFASIERIEQCCQSTEIHVTMTYDDTIQYTIKRCGYVCSKKRRVVYNHDDVVCAYMVGGMDHPNKYTISINPGIDQCLMVMLCQIVDQMDEYDNVMMGINHYIL